MANKKDDLKEYRKFGTALAVIATVMGTVRFLKGGAHIYPWFFGFALMVLFLTLVLPRSLRPVYTIFTKVAHAIGWFNTRILLISIYFLILTPIAALLRIFRKDPLQRKINRNVTTYWVKREDIQTAQETLERQF